ncbi:type III-A CRISPR-associated RAMP protein Csm5 [Kallotenue papyrolyticum]|uniref:type III-A CRISPR-associated RAMP protein Csm5 n=1 Tax=Kallotenue papyrolyticum TaxID=1325125 RepID=UPI000492B7C0|nr:type III-A CRISPR-associated RAMP protein Csm5 [Kallotenue papyrolyticum]
MLYDVEITTRTPVHVGAGVPPLRNKVDFVRFGRFTYVLDQQRVLDYLLPPQGDAELIERISSTYDLSSFLKEPDLRQHPELVRYRLGGAPNNDELRAQIKDVQGRPYLPGSTLKGAIRTALANALAREQPLQRAQLGPRREWAARQVEQALLSTAPNPKRMPNYDLLRALQVGDSAPVAPEALDLVNALVWPAGKSGIPISVEALREGTTLTARIKLDDYLLSSSAQQELRWQPRTEVLRRWVALCREHGLARIAQEANFFARRAPRVEQFYQQLAREAAEAADNVFYAQIGWGAGWPAKTLSRVILPDHKLLEWLIERYQLSRGPRQRGAPFPKTRRVVSYDGQQPVLPLGWTRITVITTG